MAIQIEERFEVEAPAEHVWAYFSDPARVVPCLPGAELTEVVDETTYRGRVRVQVGPVVAQYEGTARIQQMDREAGVIEMVARGRQVGQAGGAEGRMVARLTARDSGRTEVLVTSEVSISGRLAQFGRGLIADVSRQLFAQFSECARREILAAGPARPEPSGEAAAPGPGPAPVGTARPVNALALTWRVLGSRIRRLLGRLLGRSAAG